MPLGYIINSTSIVCSWNLCMVYGRLNVSELENVISGIKKLTIYLLVRRKKCNFARSKIF